MMHLDPAHELTQSRLVSFIQFALQAVYLLPKLPALLTIMDAGNNKNERCNE